MDQAMLYIRIYLLSMPFMLLYNFGAAALRSYGDSKRPMYYLLLAGVVNVVLNLLLVVGVHLGVEGVAIGTLASNVLSASLVLLCLYRREDEFQFRFENMQIRKDFLRRVLVIGVPAGIQGAIFSVSNVFIQSNFYQSELWSWQSETMQENFLLKYAVWNRIYRDFKCDFYCRRQYICTYLYCQ